MIQTIEGSIYQEDITIPNVYAPNSGTSKCIKQNDMAEVRNGQYDNYS